MTSGTATGDVRQRRGGAMGPAHRLITVSLLALVTFIAFEAMAVSTAMPVVARDLDAVRSYGLAFSFLLTAELLGIVLAGLWCDLRGPLPALLVGQALMAAGSAVAGLALRFDMLLVGRLVAGLGSGLIIVAIYVVIGRAYPSALRPRVFSWISAAWVLPSLVGPPVAGWLATTWSWRLVFLVVLAPIAVTLVIVASQRHRITGELPTATLTTGSVPTRDLPAVELPAVELPAVELTAELRHGSPASGERASVVQRDRGLRRRTAWLGLAVAAAAGVMQWGAEQLVPLRPLPLVLTVAGLAGVAIAVPRLMPAGMAWMARGLPSVMTSRFLLTASFNGAMTFVPLMLVVDRHLSPTVAGAMLTIGALGWSFGSYVQGHDRFHGRRSALVSVGGASLALGVATLAGTAGFGWSHYVVVVGAVLSGLGMGLATSSLSVLALALVPVSDQGSASSSLQLADVLGSVMGISAAGAVFAAMHHPGRSDVPVFVLMWAVLAAVAALVVLGGQRTRT